MAGDHEVSIIVHTTAELEALTQLRDKLAAVRAQCAEGSEGAKMLDGTMSSLGKTISQGVTEPAHEAGESFTFLGLEGHSAHMAVRMLSSQMGEMGHVLHLVAAVMNGETIGAIFAVVIAVKLLKEQFEQLKAPIEEANEAMLAIEDAKIKSAAASATALASSLKDIARESGNLDAAYARGTTAMDNRIAQYGREQDALIKVEDAKEKAYEAEIDRQQALGNISKDRADKLKEDAKLQLDQFKGATDQAKLKNEIEERQTQLGDARTRLLHGTDVAAVAAAKSKEAKPASEQAEADAAKAAAEKQGIEVDISGTTERYATIEEAKKRAQEFRQEAQSNEELGASAESVATQRGYAESIDQSVRAQEKYIDNLRRIADAKAEAVKDAQAETAKAAEQLKTDQELNRTGGDKVKALQQQYDLQQRTNAQVQSATGAAAATHHEVDFNEMARRVDAGQGTPEEQKEVANYRREKAAAHLQYNTGAAEAGIGAQITAQGIAQELSPSVIARLKVTASKALRLGDTATQNTMLADVSKHIDDIDTAIATMTGLHENASTSLTSQQRNLAIYLQRLKATEDELNKVKGQLQNVSANTPR